MTTVKDAIKMLTNYNDPDEEICIAWWSKELFEEAFKSKIKEEAWESVVLEFDDMTQHQQGEIYEQIVQTIDDSKGWIEK
jgi:hypothetical protein